MTSQKAAVPESAQRAAQVLQALFYVFTEHTWALDMSKVILTPGESDDDIVKVDTVAGRGTRAGPGEPSTCERHAGGWLVKFPHESFSDNAKHALLASHNSVWAFVFMHVAVETLFGDLVDNVERDIKEVVHYLPDGVHRRVQHNSQFKFIVEDRPDILYRDEDSTSSIKGVYRITLKNGSEIALDLAGAQYNLEHDTIMPWADYLDRCVRAIKYRVPLRSHHQKHVEKMSDYLCVTHHTVILEQMGYFNQFMKNHDYALNFDMTEMLVADMTTFKKSKDRFVKGAIQHLLQRTEDIDGPSPECLAATFDIRHPKVIDQVASSRVETIETRLYDIGSIDNFSWDRLRKMIAMPGNKIAYAEKNQAKLLLTHRCVYKLPGDWKLMFMRHSLPSVRIPWSWFSENPYWVQRRDESLYCEEISGVR